MSVWEFAACVEGWNRANGEDNPRAPTEEEFEADLERMDQIFGSIAVH